VVYVNILIVKTSSLGDIVQSFPVLHFLHQLFPSVTIDWVVEKKFISLITSHPLIRHAISMDREHLFSSIRKLRQISYDVVFDLQGNSKSALMTLLARSKMKVGFGFQSVSEWPNILATHRRFNVSHHLNIRLQYLSVIAQFFSISLPTSVNDTLLQMNGFEKTLLDSFVAMKRGCCMMVCPGAQWANKQVSLEVMISFLSCVQEMCHSFFFLMWGSMAEKQFCEKIQEAFPDQSAMIEKLSLPLWQNLMSQMDVVIAMDSGALHLCGTTATASFSIFGPTSSDIFKPIGDQHVSFQGTCPYGKTFHKRCPILRSCPTGGCIKNISPDELFQSFSIWWNARKQNSSTRP